MTARASVRLNLRELDGLSDRWSEAIDWIQDDPTGAQALALKGAQLLVGEVRSAILDSATGSSLPGQRTGALARSFREQVKVTKLGLRMSATSKLVYAGIQDRGGRIFPKRGSMLAIPMTTAAVRRWPRDWPKGKLFRPRGKSYLAESVNGRLKVHYLLRSSVRIKPKRYLEQARKQATPVIARMFVKALAREVVR